MFKLKGVKQIDPDFWPTYGRPVGELLYA